MGKEAKVKTKKQKAEALEDILMNCRDELRGRATLTDKRDMLLTLVFLKFISERYHARCEQIKAEYAEEPDLAEILLSRDSTFGEVGVFRLEEATDWASLKLVPVGQLAVALDDASSKLHTANKQLKNALPLGLFVSSGTDGNVLKKVIDQIDKIDHTKFNDKDLIGRVYEYFLQAFAIQAKDSKEDGEFYTPKSIVELIATLIEPFNGKLYDPCCGSGGMFVQCAKFVEKHGGNSLAVNVYGQESDPTTYRLAKMNLAVRGLSFNLGEKNASSFTEDQHRGSTFDYIMANPPFNLKKWYDARLEKDQRWADYSRPPESNANYAWILHILSKLDDKNGVAGFLLANGALDDEDTLGIRQKLIENDKVEAIIVLPREMFYSTDISVTLWILNENKSGGKRNGRFLRNRKGEILFIDLRTWNTHIYEKKYVRLTEEQIEAVHKIYLAWQIEEHPNGYAQAELYRAVGVDEIKDNNWSLVPSRYIEFVDRDQDLDYNSVFAESSKKIKELLDAQAQNGKALVNAFKAIGYENAGK